MDGEIVVSSVGDSNNDGIILSSVKSWSWKLPIDGHNILPSTNLLFILQQNLHKQTFANYKICFGFSLKENKKGMKVL